MSQGWHSLAAWGMDYCQAFYDLPKWRRLLILVISSKVMRREFQGIAEHPLTNPWFGYSIEGCDYHKDTKGIIEIVSLAETEWERFYND